MIYLDNAATTKISPEVLDAMMPYLTDNFGNAGTLYSLGRKAADAVAHARQQVADMLNCEPEQIIFTSGGTEANNLVFFGLRQYLMDINKTHIITSSVEHDSVLKSVQKMCTKSVFDATYLNVTRQCKVLSQSVKKAITNRTGIVSVMFVNNETGTSNPVSIIGDICKKEKVLFHTDGVQAAGNKELDVNKLGCDFLSISSHKLHGPKGVGALYVRDKSLLAPVVCGGSEQEFGLRGGTENTAAIVGMGVACEMATKNLESNSLYISKLRALFCKRLLKELETHGISRIMQINGSSSDGKVLNLRFKGVDGQTLVLFLDSKGIFISAGSACRSNDSQPSHVLLSMGMTPEEAMESVRISFSDNQSEGEILVAASEIGKCVASLIKRSTWKT